MSADWKKDQWPNNICSGKIEYAPASNYNGFVLRDASHGIPTFGSVSPTEPITMRGQHVHIFNYPKQTEAIAAQLVERWNGYDDLQSALATERAKVAALTDALEAERKARAELEAVLAGADAAVAHSMGHDISGMTLFPAHLLDAALARHVARAKAKENANG